MHKRAMVLCGWPLRGLPRCAELPPVRSARMLPDRRRVSLRVLIIAHDHPALSPGGAEWASYLLFRELRRADGVEAHFLASTTDATQTRPGATFSAFRRRPDETLFLTARFDRFLFMQTSPHVQEEFADLLSRINPDVIHFHHYLNIGVELIKLARHLRPKARILVTLHEYLAICHHYGLMVKTHSPALCEAASADECALCFPPIAPAHFSWRRAHIQACFDHADLFIAPSKFLRRRYIEWGMPEHRIVVVDNGTGPVRPPRSRARPRGEGRPVFGYFGQIHPFKGLLQLLSAFDHLAQLPADAVRGMRLIINGAYLELNDPAYIASFQRLLERTAPRVHFAGPYDRRSQRRLMAEVDWVVVPSIWWENSPLVIEEAFAHRRPVICSDIGGMAEKVRPGLDGFHFPVGNPLALADLMVQLARDETVWDRLQDTMRRPLLIRESAELHLGLYRGHD